MRGVVYQQCPELIRGRLHPTHKEAYCALSHVYKELGRLDEAANCYRACLKHHPTCASVWGFLAGVVFEQGNLSESITLYQVRRCKLDPARPRLEGTTRFLKV